MEIQWGKSSEYTLSLCSNFHWWSGELALPIKISWWNSTDASGSKCNSVAVTILCFRIELEVWRWANRTSGQIRRYLKIERHK